MGEQMWMKFVHWPPCEACNASGVAIDPKTQWPSECLRCKAGRERAVKVAQNDMRHAAKTAE